VAEHDDLDILLDAAETMNPKQLDGVTDQTVEERGGHDRRGPSLLSCLVKLAFGFVHPTSKSRELPGRENSECRHLDRQRWVDRRGVTREFTSRSSGVNPLVAKSSGSDDTLPMSYQILSITSAPADRSGEKEPFMVGSTGA
jgi:hypothetical protein